MSMLSRRAAIVDLVRQEGNITINQLREALPEVSEITIRRDLEALDKERQLVRVRGGAKSLEFILSVHEDFYTNRLVSNTDAKQLIAHKAVKLLQPKDSVYLDSGSTAFFLSGLIPDLELVITTTGLTCAIELAKLHNVSLQIPGGMVNKNSFSVNGDVSVAALKSINFNTAFLGITGYLSDGRFVTSVAEDFLLKKTVVANSQQVVILMDSSKVGKLGAYTIATLDEVDVVICDEELPVSIRSKMESKGIIVI